MQNDIEVVFFDLFQTLVLPKYGDSRNENDVLRISIEEWQEHAEDNELYAVRATGKEKDPYKIIESIFEKMKIKSGDNERNEILRLREERFKRSLINVDSAILDVLSDLKKKGKKLCLISNADIIDVMHWDKSPLYTLFDEVIFSYEVGYIKPQIEIYELALKRMGATPEKCIFIGDGGSDELKGAKLLGIKTILTGYLLKRDVEQHTSIKEYADYYIEDFQDICKILFE